MGGWELELMKARIAKDCYSCSMASPIFIGGDVYINHVTLTTYSNLNRFLVRDAWENEPSMTVDTKLQTVFDKGPVILAPYTHYFYRLYDRLSKDHLPYKEPKLI